MEPQAHHWTNNCDAGMEPNQQHTEDITHSLTPTQLLYYMGYGALVAAGGFVFGSDLDVDMFLSAHSIHFSSVPGWVTSIATVAAGAIG